MPVFPDRCKTRHAIVVTVAILIVNHHAPWSLPTGIVAMAWCVAVSITDTVLSRPLQV